MNLLSSSARKGAAAALVALLLGLGAVARADELRIGVATLPTSVDPHFYNLQENISLSMHVFDRLTQRGADASLQPALALSWRPLGDTVWEFTLRQGVRWHDGQNFTADDVAFTVARAPNVPNSPSSFAGQLRAITRVEVIDAATVRFHTAAPTPNLPGDLATIAIVSRHAGDGASTDDYNSGKAATGTGPYRLVHYTTSERVELVRNEDWWGDKPAWERVTIRGIPNAASRVAALLAGDVDLIDKPPSSVLAKLRSESSVAVFSRQGLRVIMLGPDFTRQGEVPDITDLGGTVLAKNPLLDLRVRQALSLGIDRQALADRVMEGAAVPTAQWMPPGTAGHVATIKPEYDPKKARALLAEAGFPQGFKLLLHAPNDRYPNDAATAQAIAQMWSRIGVATQVEVAPGSIYSPRGVRHDYAMGLWGWSNNTAEAGYALLNMLGSQDKATGRGVSNVAGYANPALDALADRALSTLDDGKRDALLQEAMALAARDVAYITLFHLANSWATRKGLIYEARADEQTIAMAVSRAR